MLYYRNDDITIHANYSDDATVEAAGTAAAAAASFLTPAVRQAGQVLAPCDSHRSTQGWWNECLHARILTSSSAS